MSGLNGISLGGLPSSLVQPVQRFIDNALAQSGLVDPARLRRKR